MANDKIEITDEMIADAKMCGSISCNTCRMNTTKETDDLLCVELFAAALEAERAKEPGVWDGAPTGATEKTVTWTRGNFTERLGGDTYTRDPPKPLSRLRAESIIGQKGEKLDGDEWDRAVAAVERELG